MVEDIEVKMADKVKALDRVWRYFGLLLDGKNQSLTNEERLTRALALLRTVKEASQAE